MDTPPPLSQAMAKSPIRFLLLLFGLPALELRAASILSNGDFTGSTASWTTSGTVVNTGDAAVFSDSVATPTSMYQSGVLARDLSRIDLVFDLFNRLSATVPTGFVADAFFATLYFGTAPFGATLAGGSFEQAVGLFDLDSSGAFNVAPGATFGPSPKGAGWTRYTLSQVMAPGSPAGFATLAFEFYNLNGSGADSVVAVDNVSLVTVPEAGVAALLIPATLCLLVRRRRSADIS